MVPFWLRVFANGGTVALSVYDYLSEESYRDWSGPPTKLRVLQHEGFSVSFSSKRPLSSLHLVFPE